jgi:hypothetical protein
LLKLSTMDALDLLRAQHAEILGLFTRVATLDVGERWYVLDILVEAIDLHRRVVPLCLSSTSVSRSSPEDFDRFRRVRDELTALDPADPRFLAELADLQEQATRHCRREQERLFPAMERQLDSQARLALAKAVLDVIAEFEREGEREDWGLLRQVATVG